MVPHLDGTVEVSAGYGVAISGECAGGGVGLQASLLTGFDDVLVVFGVAREPEPEGSVLGAGHELFADVRVPAAAVERRCVPFGPGKKKDKLMLRYDYCFLYCTHKFIGQYNRILMYKGELISEERSLSANPGEDLEVFKSSGLPVSCQLV